MQACGHIPIWSGDRVLRTNARGRHTYCSEFKRWIVEQAQRPGMSLAGLAMSNQVNANQLRRWVQLHGTARESAAAAPSLLPVMITAAPTAAPAVAVAAVPMPATGPACVEIEVAGAVVRVRDGVAPATLRVVLGCLRDATP